MMDPIVIGLIVVVALGGAYYVANRSSDSKSDSKPAVGKVPAKAKAKAKAPAKPKAPVSERVAALKSSDAVKKGSAPVAKKLPTKTALLKLTKKKIEETAREYDIELDARMTKENMVGTFLKEARAAAKAAKK
jgi:hypothetical protein